MRKLCTPPSSRLCWDLSRNIQKNMNVKYQCNWHHDVDTCRECNHQNVVWMTNWSFWIQSTLRTVLPGDREAQSLKHNGCHAAQLYNGSHGDPSDKTSCFATINLWTLDCYMLLWCAICHCVSMCKIVSVWFQTNMNNLLLHTSMELITTIRNRIIRVNRTCFLPTRECNNGVPPAFKQTCTYECSNRCDWWQTHRRVNLVVNALMMTTPASPKKHQRAQITTASLLQTACRCQQTRIPKTECLHRNFKYRRTSNSSCREVM